MRAVSEEETFSTADIFRNVEKLGASCVHVLRVDTVKFLDQESSGLQDCIVILNLIFVRPVSHKVFPTQNEFFQEC